jgi:hypothetical protein
MLAQRLMDLMDDLPGWSSDYLVVLIVLSIDRALDIAPLASVPVQLVARLPFLQRFPAVWSAHFRAQHVVDRNVVLKRHQELPAPAAAARTRRLAIRVESLVFWV